MPKYNVLAEVELHDRIYEAGTTVELDTEVAEPLVSECKLSLIEEAAQLGAEPAPTEPSVEEAPVEAPTPGWSPSQEELMPKTPQAEEVAQSVSGVSPEEQSDPTPSEEPVKAPEEAPVTPGGSEPATTSSAWMGNHTV